MGKTVKVVVCGSPGVGKTAVLEQAIYGSHVPGKSNNFPTVEDIYVAMIDSDKGKEKVRFYDTAGLDNDVPDLPKHYFSIADITIIALGNKVDLDHLREVDISTATAWAHKEKVKLFEVSVKDRRSILEPLVFMATRMSTPSSKSSFQLGRKAKQGSFNSSEA
ncbi:NF-kappa-B inhibitor-interacting Ras-like protein 2 [Ptychodera flava]|uniref:NF-kappa-B inhibitor-interacting Ras-like protein 2 n=1 Tax=Ptychodera flava TaxID=63121 RepID=UPI00396A75ED